MFTFLIFHLQTSIMLPKFKLCNQNFYYNSNFEKEFIDFVTNHLFRLKIRFELNSIKDKIFSCYNSFDFYFIHC